MFELREVRIRLWAAACYPVPKDDGWDFDKKDFKARFITLAVKGAVTRINKGYQVFGSKRIDASNLDDILPLFGRWGAAALRSAGIERPVLVAIPNSDTVRNTRSFRGAQIAQSIVSAFGPKAALYDGLRFRHVMQSAAKGGSRSKEHLQSAMVLTAPLPTTHTPVLVDDVCTSGGHLFAAQEVLRLAGRHVDVALVAGRTVHSHQQKMIEPAEEILTESWVKKS